MASLPVTMSSFEYAAPYMEHIRKSASQEYPDFSADESLYRYIARFRIKGIFFLDENGERCIWMKDVDTLHHKILPLYQADSFEKIVAKKISWEGREHRFFLRQKMRTLEQIDAPKESLNGIIRAHSSEKGWNLPETHERHILQFPSGKSSRSGVVFFIAELTKFLPAEVLHAIFTFVLVPLSDRFVKPSVNTTNRETGWCIPDYTLATLDSEKQELRQAKTILSTQGHDGDGVYTELRTHHHAPMDASFLRTSKKFHAIGIRLLYSNLGFLFSMTGTPWPTILEMSHHMAERTLDSKEFFKLLGDSWQTVFYEKIPWCPNPDLPGLENLSHINQGISEISRRVSIKRLAGWAYHSPFLRFLYTIGPRNSALLKHIVLSGIVKVHEYFPWCHRGRCRNSDLVLSLQHYIPAIITLCPGVEKLSLQVLEDRHMADAPRVMGGDGYPMTIAKALLPVLENDLRRIDSLKVLEVVFVCRRINHDEDMSFADETIAWFANRKIERFRTSDKGALKRIETCSLG